MDVVLRKRARIILRICDTAANAPALGSLVLSRARNSPLYFPRSHPLDILYLSVIFFYYIFRISRRTFIKSLPAHTNFLHIWLRHHAIIQTCEREQKSSIGFCAKRISFFRARIFTEIKFNSRTELKCNMQFIFAAFVVRARVLVQSRQVFFVVVYVQKVYYPCAIGI